LVAMTFSPRSLGMMLSCVSMSSATWNG